LITEYAPRRGQGVKPGKLNIRLSIHSLVRFYGVTSRRTSTK
jgi:hypothetical protein